jgi:hypothetical protein
MGSGAFLDETASQALLRCSASGASKAAVTDDV